MREEMHRDIEKVSAEDLVELYGLLGLFGREKTHRIRKDDLSRDYNFGLDSAIYHLWSEDRLRVTRHDRIQLSEREEEVAEKIADEIYWNDRTAEELIEQEEVPEYLTEPETSEESNSPPVNFTQEPEDELYTRIIEILQEEPMEADEVEEEMAVEINFDLEPKLRYLETQGVAERRKDGYIMNDEAEIKDRLRGEHLNSEGWLIDAERYGNDPWKPDR